MADAQVTVYDFKRGIPNAGFVRIWSQNSQGFTTDFVLSSDFFLFRKEWRVVLIEVLDVGCEVSSYVAGGKQVASEIKSTKPDDLSSVGRTNTTIFLRA